jgi:SAM-dependent methyltransferase
MHRSSLENMSKCYRRFIRGSELEASGRVTVLDVGGADVNGSYRDVFDGPQFTYLGADLAPAEWVAIVLDDPYRIPLDDASVDIVVSGQLLEHCEFFWLAFAEMMRVVKPSGFVFLIAPSAGPIHRYPVDCYRFYPDGFRALAKYANCEAVEIWQDERGPWNDLVGVFRRRGRPSAGRATARRRPRPAIRPRARSGVPRRKRRAATRTTGTCCPCCIASWSRPST